MIDKFGSTPLLLNGQAASFLQQGKFEEAEAALQEAIEKDSSNPDTIVNMIVLSQLTGKAPEVGRDLACVVQCGRCGLQQSLVDQGVPMLILLEQAGLA